jgi:hypothetical protein
MSRDRLAVNERDGTEMIFYFNGQKVFEAKKSE